MPTGDGRHPPQRSARRPPSGSTAIVGQRALGGRGIAPGTAAPQVFERVPLIEPVKAVHQIGLLSGQLAIRASASRVWRRGRSCSTRVCTWASSASESRPSSSPSWAEASASAAGFSTDTPEDVENFSGCLQPARRSRGSSARRARRLTMGSPPCWIISAIVPQDGEKEKGGGTLNASRRHSVSAGPEIPARPGGKPVRAPAGAPAAGRATERTRRPPACRVEGGDRAPRRPRSG